MPLICYQHIEKGEEYGAFCVFLRVAGGILFRIDNHGGDKLLEA